MNWLDQRLGFYCEANDNVQKIKSKNQNEYKQLSTKYKKFHAKEKVIDDEAII